MLDTHARITGIMPYIFGIPAYSLFVGLGIAAGLIYYILDARRRQVKNEGVIIIVAAALIFGAVGSKIPLLFESRNVQTWIFGKSIVGGLISGVLGVILIKKLLKIKLRMGNIIAPAAALGLAIGRLGCFFSGCCYGRVSSWGVDFGDAQLRYPTQLFESAFHLTAFLILNYYRDRTKTPGILFKIYLFAYFIFRFLIEFIRVNPKIWLGLSIYQIICIVGLLYMTFVILRMRCRHEF